MKKLALAAALLLVLSNSVFAQAPETPPQPAPEATQPISLPRPHLRPPSPLSLPRPHPRPLSLRHQNQRVLRWRQ